MAFYTKSVINASKSFREKEKFKWKEKEDKADLESLEK